MPNRDTKSVSSFSTTHWPLVDEAGKPNLEALNALLLQYQGPLKAHLKMKFRVSAEQAEDWFQGFVLEKVMANQMIAQANRQRGKFRTFLLNALDNYALNELRREQTQKRGQGIAPAPLEEAREVATAVSAGAGASRFDVEWARRLLGHLLERMQQHCASEGRTDLWGVFEARVLRQLLSEAEVEPYERLVKRLEFKSAAQATNALHTAKRMFKRMLREEVTAYVKDESEVEGEIRELKAILFEAGVGG